MNRYLTPLLILAIFFIGEKLSLAQNEVKTLFGENDIKSTWYGQIDYGISYIDSKNLFLSSFEGGVVLNNKLGLGLNVKISANDPVFDDLDNFTEEVIFKTLFGGLMISPIFYNDRIVHFSAPLLIGGGMAGYLTPDRYSTITNSGDTRMRRRVIDSDGFFAFEPSLVVEINITSRFRLISGVSYRFAGGLDLISSAGDAFNSPTFKMGLIIGKR